MSGFFTSVSAEGFTTGVFFICIAAALVCGAMTAFTSAFRQRISRSFLVSLILLPAIVATVIIMVNGNIGTGVAVMGAFSLVRFRSAPGKAKEIVAIFLAMTAGLACAAGYVWVALVFTALVCLIMIALSFVPVRGERELDLRITVPESLNYTGAFDDLFDRYTISRRLVSVRTSNMGSMYKLVYRIELKKGADTREFIDGMRCRNGNLEIMISEAEERGDEL